MFKENRYSCVLNVWLVDVGFLGCDCLVGIFFWLGIFCENSAKHIEYLKVKSWWDLVLHPVIS